MKIIWLNLFISLTFFMSCSVNNQAKVENNENTENKTIDLANLSEKKTDPKKEAGNQGEIIVDNSQKQGIRSIDFKNFTYNWFPKYGERTFKKKIILKNGENEKSFIEGPDIHPNGELYYEYLVDAQYADLTGDGQEEAMVSIAVSFYRWDPGCIFIFTEQNNKARLLWRYETNAFGSDLSLRDSYINDGEIVIEENDTNVKEPPFQPLRYFQKKYSWNGKTFELKNVQIIPL